LESNRELFIFAMGINKSRLLFYLIARAKFNIAPAEGGNKIKTDL